MSDISSLKWAENVQKARVEEALEAKRQIEETEARFQKFAEVALAGSHGLDKHKIDNSDTLAGIYIFDIAGKLTYANREFEKILYAGKDIPLSQFEHMDWILPEDVAYVNARWASTLVGHLPASSEFRLKRTWRTPEGEDTEVWVASSTTPTYTKDGKFDGGQGMTFLRRIYIQKSWTYH